MTNRALKEMGVTRISVVIKFTFFTIKNTLKKKKRFRFFLFSGNSEVTKIIVKFQRCDSFCSVYCPNPPVSQTLT